MSSLCSAQSTTYEEDFNGTELPENWVFTSEYAPVVTYVVDNSEITITRIDNSPGVLFSTLLQSDPSELTSYRLAVDMSWTDWDYQSLSLHLMSASGPLAEVILTKDSTVSPHVVHAELSTPGYGTDSASLALTGSYGLEIRYTGTAIELRSGSTVIADTSAPSAQTPDHFFFSIANPGGFTFSALKIQHVQFWPYLPE